MKEDLIAKLDLSRELTDTEVMTEIEETVLEAGRNDYISAKEKSELCLAIFNSIRRLGPLQSLIDDKEISEIMVNGPNHIFIEKKGKIVRFEGKMESEEQLEDIIQQIVAKVNRTVNEACPIVDARLTDGSRVNVVLPPVAVHGAALTIRKFPVKPMDMERLFSYETLTRECGTFLEKIIKVGCNIIVGGGTSSGKTSFLNALSDYIPKEERVIVIEDSTELQIFGIPNLVQLETRNSNMEGKGEIGMGDLIKSSLRMRPDRLLIGEVRDEKAAVMLLNALNTGHYGESTIHSNSAGDTVTRLETLLLMNSGIPIEAVRRQILSAIDYILYLGRLKDGSRKLLEVCELTEGSNGEIKLNRIYEFDPEKGLLLVGSPTKTLKKIKMAGEDVDGLFNL